MSEGEMIQVKVPPAPLPLIPCYYCWIVSQLKYLLSVLKAKRLAQGPRSKVKSGRADN